MLRAIPASDLIFEWPRVREGLEQVKRASGDDWIPEDVYVAIKGGNATLFVIEDDDYLGFVVLQVLPTFHGKRLHVWAAHSIHRRPILWTLAEQLKPIAQAAGANKITFSSTRDEWAAIAERGGYTATQTTYTMEV